MQPITKRKLKQLIRECLNERLINESMSIENIKSALKKIRPMIINNLSYIKSTINDYIEENDITSVSEFIQSNPESVIRQIATQLKAPLNVDSNVLQSIMIKSTKLIRNQSNIQEGRFFRNNSNAIQATCIIAVMIPIIAYYMVLSSGSRIGIEEEITIIMGFGGVFLILSAAADFVRERISRHTEKKERERFWKSRGY